ncbi:MAG: HAD hydrolase-like protein [Lachnospiraceae bacterium]|nr:HAD hydrolase-like protein [Lachnospiraceae bacterium]
MYRYVLFDLDGTISDSKEGIVKSAQVGLHAMGVEVKDLDELECLIGPPLVESFHDFYGLDEAQCEEAIRIYRERYTKIGIFENELYPGMKRLLKELHEQGVKLAVASSKPQSSVDRLMKHFDLTEYFDVVMGSDPAKPHQTKQEVLALTLGKLFGIKPEHLVSCVGEELDDEAYEEMKKRADRIIPTGEVAMVGDRKFDMIAGREFFVDSIGVGYGYAADGELEACAPAAIAENMDDLYEVLTKERAEVFHGRGVKALVKSIRVLIPVVLLYVLTQLCYVIMEAGITLLSEGPMRHMAPFIAANSLKIALYYQAATSVICAIFFYHMYKKEPPVFTSHILRRRYLARFHKLLPAIIVFAASLSLFLNGGISYLQLIMYSDVYEQVESVQYSVSLFSGLLIFGIIKPIEEELVFRGLLYNRMRYYFPKTLSIIFSAVIFGAYHGNIVQFVYAFFMGLAMCYLYEKFRLLEVPLLIHALANILVYTLSSLGVLEKTFFSPVGLSATFVLALASGLILWSETKKWKHIVLK